MKKENITVYEIAKKAGVSIATVSRAMNEETRHKVLPGTLKKIDAIARRYLRFLKLNGAYLRYAVPTIERARMGDTLQRYHDEMQQEFEELREFLPPAPCTLLDIGCGLGEVVPENRTGY